MHRLPRRFEGQRARDIEEIVEETPAATGVEAEPAKPSQEPGPKKARFLRQTLADFPKGL